MSDASGMTKFKMDKLSQESEAYGCARILQAFKPVFPETRVLQNIIMPMDGIGGCPTAEFDVIVVCPAGVYVFEIKGHTGKSIEITKTESGAHRWKIHKDYGAVEIQDPLVQGGRKIKYLRESIKGPLIRGFVYFTNEAIALDPKTNADVITSNDLEYLVRSLKYEAKRRDKIQSEAEINRIADAILELSQNFTIEEHIQNCLQAGEFQRQNRNAKFSAKSSAQKKYPHPKMRVLATDVQIPGKAQNTQRPYRVA